MRRTISTVLFGALLAISVGTIAQQAPAAPIALFVVNNSGGGGGGGGGDYTCATAIAGTTGVSCPTAPTTTSSATGVTNATLAANKVNGRDITLDAEAFGDETFTTTDQIIRITGSGSIDYLTIGDNATRLRFVCVTARACSIRNIDFVGTVSDISFEDITITSPSSSDVGQVWYPTDGAGTQNRFAFINVNMDTDGWCVYASDVADGVRDIVFGNSRINGNGNSRHCLRFMGVQDTVVADSEITVDGSGYAARIHAESGQTSGNNYWLRSLYTVQAVALDADGGSGGGGTLGEQFFEDNCVHSAGAWFISTGSGANRATVGHVKNNAGFGSISWPGAGAFQSDDISGNTVSSYTAPPTFTYDGTACS